jgi:UDP-N-acetylglucosamine/UDP-N-acetylgalactosamine diphosphorylase
VTNQSSTQPEPPLTEALIGRLTAHNQGHALRFWEQLDLPGRAALAAQLEAIDFDQLAHLVHKHVAAQNWEEIARRASAPPAIRLDGQNPISYDQAAAAGRELLKAGRVAALLVAGGQGTRLGFTLPKGCFPIGPISGATLYQVLLEQVAATIERYGAAVPLFVMTSAATHAQTLGFFQEQNYFGLDPHDVILFQQGTMPAVDCSTGRLLLESPGRISVGPDGHGGTIAALARAGGFDELRRRGITQLFYFQVDNPLVKVCDPAFLGYQHLSRVDIATQAVRKRFPLDRLGNVVSLDGRVQIIEYSDLPAAAAERRQADGSLELWAGSTAVHVFDVSFLKRVSRHPNLLPFHIARKRMPYLDDQGQLIQPAEPNAIKFERFIFDLLPAAQSALVVEADWATDFAPVKNDETASTDSPVTARQQMVAMHRDWLTQVGARVATDVDVEISPRFALDVEQLRQRIVPGQEILQPRYFR